MLITVWTGLFSAFCVVYVIFVPFNFSYTDFFLSGLVWVGFGLLSFFGLVFGLKLSRIKGASLMKLIGILTLGLVFCSFLVGGSAFVIPVADGSVGQGDLILNFLDDNGLFKDYDEVEASLSSLYQGVYGLEAEELSYLDKGEMYDFLSDLVFTGFKMSRNGIGEIPNIINCFQILQLLNDLEVRELDRKGRETEKVIKTGKDFINTHFDLFIEFITIESSYNFDLTIKEGKQSGLTRENLFRDHLEMKYYALKCMEIILGNDFDEFLENASLNLDLSHDEVSDPKKIEMTWEEEHPFFETSIVYGMDIEDVFYLTELMNLVITDKDLSHTVMKRLFDLDKMIFKLQDALNFTEEGIFKLNGKEESNNLRMNYVGSKILANIHRLDLIDSRLLLNYTDNQQIEGTFLTLDQENMGTMAAIENLQTNSADGELVLGELFFSSFSY